VTTGAQPTGGGTSDTCRNGKRGYVSRREAAEHAKRLRRTNQHMDGHNRPYRCPHCDLWHVGHVPTPVIRGEITANDFYGRTYGAQP
jgi:hypothetical protein